MTSSPVTSLIRAGIRILLARLLHGSAKILNSATRRDAAAGRTGRDTAREADGSFEDVGGGAFIRHQPKPRASALRLLIYARQFVACRDQQPTGIAAANSVKQPSKLGSTRAVAALISSCRADRAKRRRAHSVRTCSAAADAGRRRNVLRSLPLTAINRVLPFNYSSRVTRSTSSTEVTPAKTLVQPSSIIAGVCRRASLVSSASPAPS